MAHASLRSAQSAPRTIAQHVMDATVDFAEGTPEVVTTKQQYGLWFVKSSKFDRWYIVNWLQVTHMYTCTCDHYHYHYRGCCSHIRKVSELHRTAA